MSYGWYMSRRVVTFDSEHRFRCAVPKYGDCDITTSWAQGCSTGVQDLERMMKTPAQAREAYIAGSPYFQLENVEVPLLIADGERDECVSPKQSEQLVERLRELARLECLSYPTYVRTLSPGKALSSTSTGGWSGFLTGISCDRVRESSAHGKRLRSGHRPLCTSPGRHRGGVRPEPG